MKTQALSPSLTARLAKDVYALTALPSVDMAIRQLNSTYKEFFDFTDNNLVSARSGGPLFIKCRTAFGFTLIGKGPLSGHAVILIRGTEYLADWLTNFNFTVSRSSYGQPVHDGFGQALRSMRPHLQQFMDLCHGKTIHCIGHSLGGALATICAEWIVSSHRVKPYVYTFGSPRVGMFGFADMCTQKIGPSKIYRAYHKTDIVPWLPTWPFIHTPNRGVDYYMPSPGIVPSSTWHDMEKYASSVQSHTWDSLSSLKAATITDAGIIQWLKDVRPVAISLTALEWLNHALIFVLEKCMQGAARVISQTFTTTFTLMDSIAYILRKGINLAETVSVWVVYLMRKILILLGQQPTVEAADLSQQYMRAVLLQLQQKANHIAKQALSDALVKGRAL